MTWLDPDNPHTVDFLIEFPFISYDLASELAKYDQPQRAIRYLELLRAATEEPDAVLLVLLGRCYLATGLQSTAEECFHAAIDAEEYNIDARIELANMYEKAREDEEALILAAEAMALKEAQGQPALNEPLTKSSFANFQSSRTVVCEMWEPLERGQGLGSPNPNLPKQLVSYPEDTAQSGLRTQTSVVKMSDHAQSNSLSNMNLSGALSNRSSLVLAISYQSGWNLVESLLTIFDRSKGSTHGTNTSIFLERSNCWNRPQTKKQIPNCRKCLNVSNDVRAVALLLSILLCLRLLRCWSVLTITYL